MKIALATIIKDDSSYDSLKRMLTSFAPYVSGIYIAVTGTSQKHDKIHKLVKEFGGKSISTSPETHPKIYSEIDGKWYFTNFAEARNVSFSLIDNEVDYITWADEDDVIIGGEQLLEIAKQAKDEGVDAVYFPYWYLNRFDDKGNVEQVVIDHLRERLIKPGVFKWVSRLHECCVAENYHPKQTMYQYDEKLGQTCAWVHMKANETHKETFERNKLILEIQAKEQDYKDPRTLFYLAKVHFEVDEYDKSEEYLVKYLGMSGWDAERANALEYLGLIYAKRGNYQKCVEIYLQAIYEYPKDHLLYLRLADAYYQTGRDEFAEHWLEVVSKMPAPRSGTTIGNTFEIKLLTATLNWTKARRHNNIKDMEMWATIRAKLLGEDDGLLADVLYYKNLNYAVEGVFNLSKWLKDSGYEDKISKIIENLPNEILTEPAMAMLINNVVPGKKWGESIVYYASFGSPHFETWDGNSLAKGIGGSETAVIRLAEEWAKSKPVTVFCDCGEEKIINGVTYKPYTLINWNDEFDTLILWRSPHLLDKDIKANKLFMDLHDVASPLDWTEERIKKIDKIFFKSKYHRNNLPNVPDEKCIVIANGI